MQYSRKTQQGVEAARDLYRRADEEGRDLSRHERDAVTKALDAARRERGVRELDQQIGGGALPGGDRPGDQFVASKGYQQIRNAAARPTQWSISPVEVKATLSEAVSPVVQPGLAPGDPVGALPAAHRRRPVRPGHHRRATPSGYIQEGSAGLGRRTRPTRWPRADQARSPRWCSTSRTRRSGRSPPSSGIRRVPGGRAGHPGVPGPAALAVRRDQPRSGRWSRERHHAEPLGAARPASTPGVGDGGSQRDGHVQGRERG